MPVTLENMCAMPTASVGAPPTRPNKVVSPTSEAAFSICSTVMGKFCAETLATMAAGSPFMFMLKYTPGSSVHAAIIAMMATSDSRHIAP